jgi:hypothetical protein
LADGFHCSNIFPRARFESNGDKTRRLESSIYLAGMAQPFELCAWTLLLALARRILPVRGATEGIALDTSATCTNLVNVTVSTEGTLSLSGIKQVITDVHLSSSPAIQMVCCLSRLKLENVNIMQNAQETNRLRLSGHSSPSRSLIIPCGKEENGSLSSRGNTMRS